MPPGTIRSAVTQGAAYVCYSLPDLGGTAACRNHATTWPVMTNQPDFRTDKSDSVEGAGRATAPRWYAYPRHPRRRRAGGGLPDAGPRARRTRIPTSLRDDIAEDAMEQSELIGFWVAWHMAGGFAALEEGGWRRATIFRKVRRFRARYGAHPDDYSFSPGSDSTSTPPGPSRSPARSRSLAVEGSADLPAPQARCACTTPTRSEPTCSPRRRRACLVALRASTA